MNVNVKADAHYTAHAHWAFEVLDSRVTAVLNKVTEWEGWKAFTDSETPPQTLVAMVREIIRSVIWYQGHTTEAAFHMIGRMPRHEVRLMQSLASHKAEEAEHILWAIEDYRKLAGPSADIDAPATPTTFAVAAVWWRMATTEEPLGYLGAEYMYEQLTALVTKAALPVIESRNLPREGLRFVIEHATEDVKHATFIKHQILDVVSRYPDSLASMVRCMEYFEAVYPIPVWDEAYRRAMAEF